MVRLLLLLLLPAASALAQPDYKLGDVLREDVIAPSQLIVVDAEKTAALKQAEAKRIPAVYRHFTNLAEQVESQFKAHYSATRGRFLTALRQEFNGTLTPAELSSERYQRLLESFQNTNEGFPVSQSLAALWAQAQPDRVVQASHAASLQETMSRLISNRPVESPAGIKLLRVGSETGEVPLSVVTNSRTIVQASQVVSLEQAREALVTGLAHTEPKTVAFLLSLLRPNCELDEKLTQQLRQQHLEGVWTADRYEAGQVIARRGQIVDPQIKAALNQIHERSAISRLQQQRQDDVQRAQEAYQLQWWLIGGMAAGIFLLLLIVLRLSKSPRNMALAPRDPLPAYREGSVNVSINSPLPGELPAEGVMAQMGRVLRDGVVRKLVDQRSEMIDIQEKASQEMAELEARLEKVHAPLKDRLETYELRIAELERELARKGEENRELIQAKIKVTQQQIAATKERLDFN